MYIKAVKADFTNLDGTETYELGKEYKGYTYYFTDEESIGIIPEIPGFEGEKLLKARFLQIEPIDTPYDTGFGHFTSKHIKVIKEIPIVEIREIFELQGQSGWFHYAEEEAKKSAIKHTKKLYNQLKSLLKL